MKKVLRKYILTLCTLLIGGYGFVYANLKEDLGGNYVGKVLKRLEYVCLTPTQNTETKISSPVSASKISDRDCSEETDDQSLQFSIARKSSTLGHHFSAFSIQKLRYLFSGTQKQMSFYQHFVNGSSRYLILQVLRL